MSFVNLIPIPIQIKQQRARRLRRWGVAVAGSLMLLGVPLVTDWVRQAHAERLDNDNIAAQSRLVGLRGELRILTAEVDRSGIQLERATALRAKRAWSSIFSLIADRMPSGCWITSIATDPANPRAGTATRAVPVKNLEATIVIDAPRRLVIRGFATEFAEPHQFVAALKHTGVFSGVVLERTNREPALDGWYYGFELVCEW